MSQKHHNELVYSEQELFEKKRITQFLTNNNVKFDALGNVYRDYEAYIRINNLKNRLKPKIKPYLPPPVEKTKQKEKRTQSTSPAKKPKKEKQSSKPLTKKTNKSQQGFHSVAAAAEQVIYPLESSYISAPNNYVPESEEAAAHLPEIVPQQQQQYEEEVDVVDVAVDAVMQELISLLQSRKDDPHLNVQDAIKAICLTQIQRYSLNPEQSVIAINKVMQIMNQTKNKVFEPEENQVSENWSRTPRLGSMKVHSEDFSSLNENLKHVPFEKRIEMNEYLDEFILHEDSKPQNKSFGSKPRETLEYGSSEFEQDLRSADELHQSKSHHGNISEVSNRNNPDPTGQITPKSKSSVRSRQRQQHETNRSSKSQNQTPEKRSLSAKSKSPQRGSPVKKSRSKSPQWRYTDSDDYVNIEKRTNTNKKKSVSPIKIKDLKLKERLSTTPPARGKPQWNEKKKSESHNRQYESSGLKAPTYHSPLKREVRKKLDDYERLSKQKMNTMNNSFGGKFYSAVDGLLRSNNKSPSPITNRSFVYKSDPYDLEQTKLNKKRLNEEWYNEQSRKVFQDRIGNIDKNFSKHFSDRISLDQVGSSDKVKYYKMLLQKSKLNTVEKFRKSHVPVAPK